MSWSNGLRAPPPTGSADGEDVGIPAEEPCSLAVKPETEAKEMEVGELVWVSALSQLGAHQVGHVRSPTPTEDHLRLSQRFPILRGEGALGRTKLSGYGRIQIQYRLT